jgi:hypothetical protein
MLREASEADFLTVILPGGYVHDDGVVHREVELRPLTGREEELLAGERAREVASLVTTILQRCLRRIGTITPVSQEMIRSLAIADRQYLLLKLRELNLGDTIRASVFCPWSDCGKKISVSFLSDDIPVIESLNRKLTYKMELSVEAAFVTDSGESYREIVFRLPNGSDQEELASIVVEDEIQAQALLLQRCLHSIGSRQDPDEKTISRLSPLARLEIERQMEAVAPKVELTMESTCPECGREYAVPFDVQNFFLRELRTNRDLLYREVHYLAFHYHWSEREIMNMPRQKRRTYIEVLSSEIERLNDAT